MKVQAISIMWFIRCDSASFDNNNETEADQPGPAQLVGVQSAPLPSPGLEVNTPALCQHPQVAREHGYQGLPADIQLEEGLRRWPE